MGNNFPEQGCGNFVKHIYLFSLSGGVGGEENAREKCRECK